MAPRDDFNERREEIARARGFPIPYVDASGREREPESAYYQYRTAVQGWDPPDRRAQTAEGEVTYTRDEGSLDAAIRRGAREDAQLYARVTMLIDPEDGSHPREWERRNVELWARGGWNANNAEAYLDEYGSAFGMFAAQIAELERYPGVVIDVLLRAVA